MTAAMKTAMKVDFIIPCRDKARWIERAMVSAIYQDHPCRVVVSDQGSTDGSLEIIKRVAARERGNPVEVLECPVQHFKGMPGFNLHLNWLHEQLDGDVVVVCSADDYVMPGRVRDAVEAFETTGADVVLSANRFEEESGECYGYSPIEQSGFVSLKTVFETKIGGSAAQSWRRSFWNAVGGMALFPGCDMVLPHIAAAIGKCYYVNNPTHVYVRHVDSNNTGLESVALAAPESQQDAVNELMAFHRMTGLIEVLGRYDLITNGDDRSALFNEIIGVASMWTHARQQISEAGIAPRSFPMLLPARTDGAFPKAVNG